MEKGPQTIYLLQALRGFAAALVVFHHAARAFTVNWPIDLPGLRFFAFSSDRIVAAGAIGVDIFFVISGFIMVFVSEPYVIREKPVRDFIARRAIRIYPMYAIATSAVIAIGLLRFYRHFSIDALPPIPMTRIVAAFAFIPTLDSNGSVQPILGVGWTLFYEFFFYLCFASALAVFGRRIIRPLATAFCLANAIAWTFGGHDAISQFFRNTIVFEFLFGCAIGSLFQRQAISASYAWSSLTLGLVLIVAGSSFTFPESTRFIFWGVPAAIVLLSCVKLEFARVKCPPILMLLGDASYSVYLAHVIIIYEGRDVIRKMINISQWPGDLVILLFALFAIASGIAVYRVVESPLNSLLLKLYRAQLVSSKHGSASSDIQHHGVAVSGQESILPPRKV
ncbi:exopolysaccharide production protein ExoZ [Bradyrhizobium sp. RT6a]|uniref:acyltransferase family protein n=1 Tax=Bradyrhizobium sp. RT6a TaxID=3156381 RepID=UPI0033973033